MRERTTPVMAVAGLVLACASCSQPEPPDKERPVEPQAQAVLDLAREATGAATGS